MTWTLLLATALVAASPQFEAQPLAGASAVGRLADLTPQNVTLDTTAGRAAFGLESLATLTRKSPDPTEYRRATAWVALVDQSGFPAVDYTVRGRNAEIELTGGGTVRIPTAAIRWVRFTSPADRDTKIASLWSDIVDSKAAADLLVVRTTGSLDELEVVLGDIDSEACKFDIDGEGRTIRRPRVEGIVYFHASVPRQAEPLGKLQTTDGGIVALREAALDSGTLVGVTPAGVKFTWPLEQIERIDFSSGKIIYLSDLEPESESFTPYLGFREEPPALREFYRYRRNVGFEQLPLRLDGRTFVRGLALYSRTALSYRLPDKYRQFKAVVGIDDSVRELGKVRLEIKGDGKMLWEGDVDGTQPPREIELDISGVRRLEIVADYGADQDIGDRLDLADARVTK